jgi:hypothetical protein
MISNSFQLLIFALKLYEQGFTSVKLFCYSVTGLLLSILSIRQRLGERELPCFCNVMNSDLSGTPRN